MGWGAPDTARTHAWDIPVQRPAVPTIRASEVRLSGWRAPRVIGRSLRLLLGLLIPSATGETTRIIALEATTVAMLLTLHLRGRIFERWADLVHGHFDDGTVGTVLRLIGTLLQATCAITRMPFARLCAQ